MDLAIRQHGEGQVVVVELIVASQPEAAAHPARTFRVRYELVAGDPQRVAGLGLLDWRVFGVLAVALYGVRAVTADPSAVATGQRLQEAVILAAARVDAAESGVALHRLGP